MRVDQFDFSLPTNLIADRPTVPRDSARLLYVHGEGGALQDRSVQDLPSLLQPGDVLVFNNTRVIPARLFGSRGSVEVECMLHREESPGTWQALARPSKRLKIGDHIRFSEGLNAEVLGHVRDGSVRLMFNCTGSDFSDALKRYGHIPLPPYINRSDEAADRENYQTIYAERDGAVAAPTAGLHFTASLLSALEERGVESAFITLHIGLGTFQPVRTENTEDHNMHFEWGEISQEVANTLTIARGEGRRCIAVGTTSLRLLESAVDDSGVIKPFSAETNLFIVPGYSFKAVDVLMTNFHLPRSTLFMLVSAFSGQSRMQAAYAHAIEHKYRFYSYGDACLLEPDSSL